MVRRYNRAMVGTNFFLAQGGMGEGLLELMPMVGVVIVPVSIGSWLVWAGMSRPKSPLIVGWLVSVSLLFVIWVLGLIAYWNMPSVEEELAVEEVESAYPELDSSTWNYSAKQPSPDVWIISVEGHTQAGQSINKTFRVKALTVEEERSGTQEGWIMLKQWPMPGEPSPQPTSGP